jgi:ParB-like chromosome segregation protein Spo0J
MSQPRQSQRTVARKPIGWLIPPDEECRDPATLPQLAESLTNLGFLYAIIATVAGVIIAGRRRYAAAVMAGLEFVDVIVVEEGISDSAAKIIELTENRHRSQLNGYQKWIGDAEWLCMNPGAELKDLAKAMSIDPSSVTRELSPSKCIVEAQDALKAGLIGLSDTYAISKQESPDAQRSMLALKLSTGAGRDTLERIGRQRRKARKPSPRMNRVKIAVSGEIAIAVSGKGLSLELLVQALGEARESARKAIAQEWNLKEWQSINQRKVSKKESVR